MVERIREKKTEIAQSQEEEVWKKEGFGFRKEGVREKEKAM